MKKLYKIIILLVALLFLTTYSPKEFRVFSKKNNFFFEIQNIEVVNNHLIKESEIVEKLIQIFFKNLSTNQSQKI